MKKNQSIYYHQSTLVKSCEGMPMDILTVTSMTEIDEIYTQRDAEIVDGLPIDDPAGILL